MQNSSANPGVPPLVHVHAIRPDDSMAALRAAEPRGSGTRTTTASNLASEHLCAIRIHPCPARTSYRARMVYGSPLAEIHNDTLGLPAVKRAGTVVADWSTRSPMPAGFWREVTVRSSRSGAIHLKLILQLPVEGEGDCSAAAARLESLPGWPEERAAFVVHALHAVPMLSGISFQLTSTSARPEKQAPCASMYGEHRLLEEHAGFTYEVGPECFSQVNPATAELLVGTVAWWLGLVPARPPPLGSPSAASTAAAAAAAVHCRAAGAVLVSGRDVNLFGAALFTHTEHTLHIVTHCPCAHADLPANLRRRPGAACSHAHHVPKGRPTAAFVRGLAEGGGGGGGGNERAVAVAVVTAGRRGASREVCAALRELRSLRALVYVFCSEGNASRDLVELLGGSGGFAVADAIRLEHFPASTRALEGGGALLLLRRPPTLVLPLGPAGSGKTRLCRRLCDAFPNGSLAVVERDALYASYRADGLGVNAAKRHTHAASQQALVYAAAAGQIFAFDSCNASAGGRAALASQMCEANGGVPCRVLLLAFMPEEVMEAAMEEASEGAMEEASEGAMEAAAKEVPADRACVNSPGDSGAGPRTSHRALLLARVRQRRAHPTFPAATEPKQQVAALDATLAAMEWPSGQERSAKRLLLRCTAAATPTQEHALLSRLFGAIYWLVGDPTVDWAHSVGVPSARPSDLASGHALASDGCTHSTRHREHVCRPATASSGSAPAVQLRIVYTEASAAAPNGGPPTAPGLMLTISECAPRWQAHTPALAR